MNHRHLLLGALAIASAGVGCFSGSDDVPQSTGGGGTGGTAAGGSPNGGSAPGGSNGGSNPTSAGGSSGTAGAGTGGKADPCANTFFCDDFESYPTGAAPGGMWGKNESSGKVTVDGGKHASGSKAVKFAADATGYRSVMISLSDASLFPVAGNKFYGRMMFFLESAPTESVHWTFIDGYGQVPGQDYHAIYRYGGQLPIKNGNTFVGNGLMANYDTPDSYGSPAKGPSSDCWLHGGNTEVVPVGRWSCAEWEFDGPNNTMRFWLDGDALTDLTMDTTGQGCVHQDASFQWLAPTFSKIDLGWESYQTDDARTFWIDDVALGKERVGCPQQ